jgi:hypothetical protein
VDGTVYVYIVNVKIVNNGPLPALRAHDLRHAEVQHLGVASRRHDDVGRLQIAMDDPLLVRCVEGVGDLDGDVGFGWTPSLGGPAGVCASR